MTEQDTYTYQYTFNSTPVKSGMMETHSFSKGGTIYKSGYKRKFDGEHTKETFYDNKYSPEGNAYIKGKSFNGSDWKVKENKDDKRDEYDMDYKRNKYFHVEPVTTEQIKVESVEKEIKEQMCVRRSKRLQGKDPETYMENNGKTGYYDKFMGDYQDMKKHIDNKNKVDTSNLYDYMY